MFQAFSTASCLLKSFLNINLTTGPATNNCQHKAMGKFRIVIVSQFATTFSIPSKLKRTLAKKLIIGHMNTTVRAEIIIVINIGCVLTGSSVENVIFATAFPTMKYSKINPIVHMTGSSLKAKINISFFMPPMSIAML